MCPPWSASDATPAPTREQALLTTPARSHIRLEKVTATIRSAPPAAQGPGAGRDRRPRGEHVVDEQHAARDRPAGPRSAAACRAAPRGGGRPGGRRRRGAGSGPQAAPERSRQGGGDLRRRVEAAQQRSGRGAVGTGTTSPPRSAGRRQPLDAVGHQLGDRQQPAELERRRPASRATPSWGAEDQARVDARRARRRAAARASARRRAQAAQRRRLAAAEPAAGQRRGAARSTVPSASSSLIAQSLAARRARVARDWSGKRQGFCDAAATPPTSHRLGGELGRLRAGSPRGPDRRPRRSGSRRRRSPGRAIRTPSPNSTPSPTSTGPLDLDPVERAGRAHAVGDLGRAGLDRDGTDAGRRSCPGAARRGCRCRSSRRRSRASRRGRRPRAAPGRRPSPSRRTAAGRRGRRALLAPGRREVVEDLGAEHVDAAVGEVGERLGRVAASPGSPGCARRRR